MLHMVLCISDPSLLTLWSYNVIPQHVEKKIISHIVFAGHVSGVTDTRFSNLGDRILTASMDDGTARVFYWGPKFTFEGHKVFKVMKSGNNNSTIRLTPHT